MAGEGEEGHVPAQVGVPGSHDVDVRGAVGRDCLREKMDGEGGRQSVGGSEYGARRFLMRVIATDDGR